MGGVQGRSPAKKKKKKKKKKKTTFAKKKKKKERKFRLFVSDSQIRSGT